MNSISIYEEKPYLPSNLLLQWHITERCNLRCKHCYQNDYETNELDYSVLLQFLEQFANFIISLSKQKKQKIPAHITITGGEPFIRDDFIDLLEEFAQSRLLFSYGILSNGLLINDQIIKKLTETKPAFIQFSIEGNKKTHDSIRGKGNYVKTKTILKKLHKAGIRTLISFTAHKQNFKDFKQVAKLAHETNTSRLWADRLIPMGSGEQLQILSPEETDYFFNIMYKEKKRRRSFSQSKTEIAMHRALQFHKSGGHPYHCTAGESLLTIDANGNLLPCRRMPIKVGNLQDNTIETLYQNSPLLKALRNPLNTSNECDQCLYKNLCRGGLKCLSYTINGNPFTRDPGCSFTISNAKQAKNQYADF